MKVSVGLVAVAVLSLIGCSESTTPPPSRRWAELVADVSYTCGIDALGAVVCWPLPGSTEAESFDPPAAGVHGLDLGGFDGLPYACALRDDDDTIVCWGGEVGGPMRTPPPAGSFEKVRLGDVTSCGLRLDGSIACWGLTDLDPAPGENDFVDVGVFGFTVCGLRRDGTTTCWSFAGETLQAPPPNLAQISVGPRSCGLTPAGALDCWPDETYFPDPPAGVFETVAVSTNGREVEYGCTLDGDGAVQCFSLVTDEAIYTPEDARLVDLSVGSTHACGRTEAGEGRCFRARRTGLWTPPGGRFTDIAAAYGHTCAIADDGAMQCWGNSWFPSVATPTDTFVDVAVSFDFTCGVRTDGTLACWGFDSSIGGSADPALRPPTGAFVRVAAGEHTACAITVDERIVCWGEITQIVGGVPSGRFRDVVMGYSHACALDDAGSVTCWGTFSAAPDPSEHFTALSLAYPSDVCGLRDDGAIRCWGEGAGTAASPPSGSFRALSVTEGYGCAVRTDGTLACWGVDALASAGLTPLPEGRFTAVATGREHVCAIREDQTLACWPIEQSELPWSAP